MNKIRLCEKLQLELKIYIFVCRRTIILSTIILGSLY